MTLDVDSSVIVLYGSQEVGIANLDTLLISIKLESTPTPQHMKHHVLTALLCAITFSVTAFAITPEEAKKVCVTMSRRNIPVAEVLKYVSQSTNIKTHYAAAKNDAVITMEFKDVPADEVFTQVGQFAKLSVTYKDDGVYFAPTK